MRDRNEVFAIRCAQHLSLEAFFAIPSCCCGITPDLYSLRALGSFTSGNMALLADGYGSEDDHEDQIRAQIPTLNADDDDEVDLAELEKDAFGVASAASRSMAAANKTADGIVKSAPDVLAQVGRVLSSPEKHF